MVLGLLRNERCSLTWTRMSPTVFPGRAYIFTWFCQIFLQVSLVSLILKWDLFFATQKAYKYLMSTNFAIFAINIWHPWFRNEGSFPPRPPPGYHNSLSSTFYQWTQQRRGTVRLQEPIELTCTVQYILCRIFSRTQRFWLTCNIWFLYSSLHARSS